MVLNHEAGLYTIQEADVDYQKLGYFVDEDGIERYRCCWLPQEVTTTYLDTFRMAGLQVDM